MNSPDMHDDPDRFHVPEQPPYRPPSEAGSLLVRVTRGCAWNRCAFCTMYKQLSFSARDLEEIVKDLRSLRTLYPAVHSIFLADADSLTHPRLIEVVSSVKQIFPEAERITTYARLSSLRRCTEDQLSALREAGLDRIHAGLESGSKKVLKLVRKGLHPDQVAAAGQRAMAAGFELSLYVLSGLGGEDLWEDHAIETARVIGATWPHFLRLRSLALLPGSPLSDEQRAGRFQPASPLTRLREVRLMTARLPLTAPADRGLGERQTDHELEITSDHFSNMAWADGEIAYGGINGFIPSDREMLLETLDKAIAELEGARQATDPGTLVLGGKRFNM